jgi:hypothetical protein
MPKVPKILESQSSIFFIRMTLRLQNFKNDKILNCFICCF